jgi:hypothetical protein
MRPFLHLKILLELNPSVKQSTRRLQRKEDMILEQFLRILAFQTLVMVSTFAVWNIHMLLGNSIGTTAGFLALSSLGTTFGAINAGGAIVGALLLIYTTIYDFVQGIDPWESPLLSSMSNTLTQIMPYGVVIAGLGALMFGMGTAQAAQLVAFMLLGNVSFSSVQGFWSLTRTIQAWTVNTASQQNALAAPFLQSLQEAEDTPHVEVTLEGAVARHADRHPEHRAALIRAGHAAHMSAHTGITMPLAGATRGRNLLARIPTVQVPTQVPRLLWPLSYELMQILPALVVASLSTLFGGGTILSAGLTQMPLGDAVAAINLGGIILLVPTIAVATANYYIQNVNPWENPLIPSIQDRVATIMPYLPAAALIGGAILFGGGSIHFANLIALTQLGSLQISALVAAWGLHPGLQNSAALSATLQNLLQAQLLPPPYSVSPPTLSPTVPVRPQIFPNIRYPGAMAYWMRWHARLAIVLQLPSSLAVPLPVILPVPPTRRTSAPPPPPSSGLRVIHADRQPAPAPDAPHPFYMHVYSTAAPPPPSSVYQHSTMSDDAVAGPPGPPGQAPRW